MTRSSAEPAPAPIDRAALLRRDETLICAPVHDETVIMRVESGQYFGLDDIGSEIWRRLETPLRFGELVDALAQGYDAEPAVIARDVQALLSRMADQGLVTIEA